jgi:hypothetical protein
MSKRHSSASSRTDWARIDAMKDEDIVLTDEHPEASLRHMIRPIVRVGAYMHEVER